MYKHAQPPGTTARAELRSILLCGVELRPFDPETAVRQRDRLDGFEGKQQIGGLRRDVGKERFGVDVRRQPQYDVGVEVGSGRSVDRPRQAQQRNRLAVTQHDF